MIPPNAWAVHARWDPVLKRPARLSEAITDDELMALYHAQNLSTRQIGDRIGFHATTVHRRLKALGPLRGRRRHPKDPTERIKSMWVLKVSTGCHIWKWGTKYPHVYVNGTYTAVHRFLWAAEHGAIPDGLFVRHDCDDPRCVNIQHMRLGTPADNVRDMVERDRQAKGDNHPHSRIREKDVPRIRKMRDAGATMKVIAEEFGVTKATIGSLLRGETWGHVAV